MLTSAGSTLGEDCYIDSPLLMCDEALSFHLVSETGEERETHLFPQQADNVTFTQVSTCSSPGYLMHKAI